MKKIVALSFLALCALFATAQKKEMPAAAAKPFVLGEIRELQSKVLGEKRVLNIYLPDGYNKNDTVRYPVIYLLDGSADEDFIHIVGVVQYYSFEWINILPKSIVVGIANVDRRRDFTYPTNIEEDKKRYPTTGHSSSFISFLATELQPYIANNFKTNESKTLIGQSLGGLVAAEILLKKPTLFNKYVIVSPSLWWDNGSLLNEKSEIETKTFNQPTDVYIGVGKEGLTPTAVPRVMIVDASLLAEKVASGKNGAVNVLFDYLPEEDHATILHQAVLNAFKQLAGSKKP